MTRIEVHIDELVLHGFAPHGRARIGDAVEHAITTALAAHAGGLAADGGDAHADLVDAGAVHVSAQPSAGAVGTAVGNAVASAVAGVR
jgi:hypothetical protein